MGCDFAYVITELNNKKDKEKDEEQIIENKEDGIFISGTYTDTYGED